MDVELPLRVRACLQALMARDGVSLAPLSKIIGRNAAYMQQYMSLGLPLMLDEPDSLVFAQFFNVYERELAARDPWSPTRTIAEPSRTRPS